MNPYQTTYQSSYQPTSPSSVQLNMPASPGGTANAGPMFANLPFDASTHHTHPGANPGARSHGVPALQLDSSIVAVQRNLSDDEALALALSKDEAQQQVQMHAPACESDRALAVALATQEEEAMQEAVAAGADPASLMYPQLAVNWGERDSILDGRLSRLPSLVLKPRINQKHWLADHVTDDRARVIARMEEYGLVERVVQGDGACQFRSLSDQLYGSPEHHKYVRDTVVKQLKAHADQYKMYAEQDFNDYLAEMSRPTTWGDHITLKAAADAYGVRIVVLTSFKENFVLAIDPQEKRSTRVLWLSFWAEVHYNSLYPQEEPPAVLSQEEPLLGAKAWDWHWLWDLLLGG